MLRLTFMLFISFHMLSCSAQEPKPFLAYGPCEGCEAILEYGNATLNAVDTLPGFESSAQQLKISGTVYAADGKSPAANVILYVYHTNPQGIYENKYRRQNWERRHGYQRGWMKTGKNGLYTFYTARPGIYPNRSEPAHIHLTVMEPDGKYYWLSSYEFADDPLIVEDAYDHDSKRGGSGLLQLRKDGKIWVGTRDIQLGKNLK